MGRRDRVAVVGAILGLLAAGEAWACSKIGFPWAQASTSAILIAVATPDTVRTGAGDVRYDSAPGHYGPAHPREIHGQVVDVEQVGGLAAASLPGGARRAVIVPWDYAADCRPVPWTRSARWLPEGVRGLIQATLRDERHWVDGLPTLDVHTPGFQPYPHRIPWRGDVPVDSMLSIDELFTFLKLRSTFEEIARDARKATLPLRRWADEHPELAGRYPASEVLLRIGHLSRDQGLRKVDPPLAGSDHGTVSLDGASRRGASFSALLIRGDRTLSLVAKGWHP